MRTAGNSSSFFHKNRIIPALLLLSVLVFCLAGYDAYMRTSEGCLYCHADKSRMEKLGYPQFYMTQEQVEKESRHPFVTCRECHLGNGRSKAADTAHKGMLRAIYLDYNLNAVNRKKAAPQPLMPSGKNPLMRMIPKRTTPDGRAFVAVGIAAVLYHDRNPETNGYDPVIGRKACGRASCHPEQAKQFSHTVMGANYRQRTMESWLKPYGPHNCGPSFADTPRNEGAAGDRFDFRNRRAIAEELNVPFTEDHAVRNQRFCNICHVGCLDCHFTPFKGEGVHSFSKKPPSKSCNGGGRGLVSCHAGTEEYRRGGTYLGGEYSVPEGMKPDAHVKEGVRCVDCHPTGEKGMGDMERKADCMDCHIDEEDALAQSEHKNVSCAACHIRQAGGYQLTHWGEGTTMKDHVPLKKYSRYHGIFKPPIIMKDRSGIYIPVKAWPHSVSNFSKDISPFEGIRFRWPDGETRDSYALLGTFDRLPDANKHLAWIEIQQVSHSYGTSRECKSCHAGTQETESTWSFIDTRVERFDGSYRVTAGADGLRIHAIEAHSPVVPVNESAKPSHFAPWLYLGDIWKITWDFSVPGKGYNKALKKHEAALKLLERQKDDVPEKQYNKIRSVLVHNPEMGLKRLDAFNKSMDIKPRRTQKRHLERREASSE